MPYFIHSHPSFMSSIMIASLPVAAIVELVNFFVYKNKVKLFLRILTTILCRKRNTGQKFSLSVFESQALGHENRHL